MSGALITVRVQVRVTDEIADGFAVNSRPHVKTVQQKLCNKIREGDYDLEDISDA